MKHIHIFSILIILIGVLSIPNQLLAQEEAIFQLTPSSGSFNQGDRFSLDLELNSPEPITSIKSYLKFDPSTIRIESTDLTASVFPYWWENILNNEEGKIQFQASTPSPGFEGEEGLVAKINFQAIKDGEINIDYDVSSLALKPNDENILNLTASIGAQFSILSSPGLAMASENILIIISGILIVLVILYFIFKKRLVRIS